MVTPITALALKSIETRCLILPVCENAEFAPQTAAIDEAMGGRLKRLAERGDIEGKAGQTLLIPEAEGIEAERVLLMGLGKEGETTEKAFRSAVTAAAKACQAINIDSACLGISEFPVSDHDLEWHIRQSITTWNAALYRFDELKSKAEAKTDPVLTLHVEPGQEQEAGTLAATADAISAGQKLARDLANRPGNVCTPTHLAETALDLAKRHEKLDVEVLEREDMEALGMGSLLSVARGSRQPPKLIVMKFNNGADDAAPIVLVGKGITFDSGGISIKPAANMNEMKYDMGGAASVFGTMEFLVQTNLPITVIGIVPTCENMPDGDANRPGDVVTSMSGKTIEVLNTDAEGRLILCDAITYAKIFKPKELIDIATLTGACIVALGRVATGMLSNSDELADSLTKVGQRTGDHTWRLPLWEEYDSQMDSHVADMSNLGGPGAGAITAACFLHRFAKDLKWAHLDIAGTAWNTGERNTATGRPTHLLIEHLIQSHQTN
ncbi:MAG: leucyl aminopeptidase [Gammaproteobacteria bacterium]